MTDDLQRLRAGLEALPQAPDPATRAAALARAMESFDRSQGTAETVRPKSDRPARAGFLTGAREMIQKLTTRPALAMTASFAVIAVALSVYPALKNGLPRPGGVAVPASETPAGTTATPTAPALTTTAPAEIAAPPAAPLAAEDSAATGPEPGVAAQERARLAPAAREEAESAAALADAAPLGEAATGPAPLQKLRATGTESLRTPPAPAPSTILQPAPDAFAPLPEANTEAFANATASAVKIAAEDPVSTFSIDSDTASWSILRSSLANGTLPPADAVRIEEMVNYFPYDYPAPKPGAAPFRAAVNLFRTPWNENTQLLRIGIQGAQPALDARPPLNLVFLIDTSGSMQDANKLPLLKQSFRLMLPELRPEDRIALVTYAGSAGTVLPPTPATDHGAILAALDRLDAGGSTAGAEGLALAYRVAEEMGGDGRISRILLATDGDFNVGIADPEDLKAFVANKRDSGAYLSILGFGRGNLDDATMQALAQNGNGTAAYIDTLSEAQKVLVDQLSGALFPIADDVKIQIEFNPAMVAEYRLIGYETRALAREDFNNDRVDAGEIGAGHQVTALYEVTPVGSPAVLNDPLRYGTGQRSLLPQPTDDLAWLKLRYKAPGESTSRLVETPVSAIAGEADDDARFAAAIAGMGQLLTGSTYLGNWGWDDVVALANDARGDDPFGYRAEAVRLMRLAESLSR
ncbi:vWA domain-containing protein [Albidovulum sediminis]|uniref:VWA domain-containing protein n=1 Tax=Albidovulum sediminis TaxID=3066345 RepID=A0ABT2NMV0_9RHOB|nr:VWA domain-containing protein [Defluviimonas sediminis]MCT8330258.1 VWA domain-containing protein [Defluviimonas sediminis]